MTHHELGSEMHSMTLAIRQAPEPVGAELLLRRIIRRIGMRTGGLESKVWDYPVAQGGGVGYTLVQPLLESLSGVVAVDAWPEIGGGGFYLLIHSCKPFSPLTVRAWLLAHGWRVVGHHYGRVELVQRKRRWWRFWEVI